MKVLKAIVALVALAVVLFYVFKNPKQTAALLHQAFTGFASGVTALMGGGAAPSGGAAG